LRSFSINVVRNVSNRKGGASAFTVIVAPLLK